MVFTLGSPLRKPVDAALASMAADGSLAALNTKWFSPHPRAGGPAQP
jgi:ABC-type amino acid transport substrate-binding protein